MTPRASHRPKNLVTYFGGYASAILEGNRGVHIYREGDLETFCGLAARLSYGTPRVVGQHSRVSCGDCFRDAQEARRDA